MIAIFNLITDLGIMGIQNIKLRDLLVLVVIIFFCVVAFPQALRRYARQVH